MAFQYASVKISDVDNKTSVCTINSNSDVRKYALFRFVKLRHLLWKLSAILLGRCLRFPHLPQIFVIGSLDVATKMKLTHVFPCAYNPIILTPRPRVKWSELGGN